MDDLQGAVVAAKFSKVCNNFDIKDKGKIRSLIAILEFSAQTLAYSDLVRYTSKLFPHKNMLSSR